MKSTPMAERARASAELAAARRQAANMVLAAGARLAAVSDRIEEVLSAHRASHRPLSRREQAIYEALTQQEALIRERLELAEQRFRALTEDLPHRS